MSEIERLRETINAIDEQIVRLLTERARVALAIGRTKRALGIPLHDAARENAVLERAQTLNQGPASDRALQAVYRNIIDMCLEVQLKDGE